MDEVVTPATVTLTLVAATVARPLREQATLPLLWTQSSGIS
jgi:hypothetical protein